MKKRNRSVWIASLSLASVLSLAGCGNSGVPTAQAIPTVTPTPISAQASSAPIAGQAPSTSPAPSPSANPLPNPTQLLCDASQILHWTWSQSQSSWVAALPSALGLSLPVEALASILLQSLQVKINGTSVPFVIDPVTGTIQIKLPQFASTPPMIDISACSAG